MMPHQNKQPRGPSVFSLLMFLLQKLSNKLSAPSRLASAFKRVIGYI